MTLILSMIISFSALGTSNEADSVISVSRDVMPRIVEMIVEDPYMYVISARDSGLLHKYDMRNDEIIQSFGGHGEGPSEHRNLTDFDMQGDSIYTYDVTMHRINVYHKENGFQYSRIIDNRLTDIVIDEHYLYGFHGTGMNVEKELSVIYDRTNMEKVTNNYEVSDLLLDLGLGSGGPGNPMTVQDGIIYFSHSFEHIVEKVTMSDFSAHRTDISEQSDIYEEYEGDAIEQAEGRIGSKISAISVNLHTVADRLFINLREQATGQFFLEKYHPETLEIIDTAELDSQIVMYMDENHVYTQGTEDLSKDYVEIEVHRIDDLF